MFQLRKTALKSQPRMGLLGKKRRRLANQSAMATTVKIKPKSDKSDKVDAVE